MVFGILIDVPLLTIPFVLMLIFRMKLTATITKAKLPRIALYLLTSIPLIVFEEQIDCEVAWCGKVIVPPTLPFLLLEMLVLGIIVSVLHAKSVLGITLVFSIYGIFFELLIGGLRGAPLSGFTLFLIPWVGLGYAFISMLPLAVLLKVDT